MIHNIPKKQKERELKKAGWKKLEKGFWLDPTTDISYLLGLAYCVLKQHELLKKPKKKRKK